MRKVKQVFSVIVGIILVGLVAALIGYNWYNTEVDTPASDSANIVSITVTEGENLTQIATELKELGALRNLEVFKIYIRLNPQNFALQIGNYEIPQNLTIPQLLERLQQGPKLNSVKVLIPEGLRSDEITQTLTVAFAEFEALYDATEFSDILQNPDGYQFAADIAEFLDAAKPQGASLEGYLFPDTYNIGTDASSQEIAELLIRTLIVRLEQNSITSSSVGRLASFYEVLKVASIVQREAKNLEDMKLVADIFLRRYEQGWVLGADAPVLYPYKRWLPAPTAQELETNDPYNLRKLPGLTPTPISNPGIDAIMAVLNPTPNQYYYFISDSSGVNHYAVTLNEHQANINKYLR